MASAGGTTDGDWAGPGETGLSAARGPGREGMASGGTPGRPGIPGTRPPDHMRVLAGEAGLLAAGLLTTGTAVTIALPHAWHRLTVWAAPGFAAGSGAWQ
jgi:hypothetical protein